MYCTALVGVPFLFSTKKCKLMKPIYYLCLLAFGAFAITACEKLLPTAPEEHEGLDGTIEGLTGTENAQFLRGDLAFSRNFTPATGLGPLFVSNSLN